LIYVFDFLHELIKILDNCSFNELSFGAMLEIPKKIYKTSA